MKNLKNIFAVFVLTAVIGALTFSFAQSGGRGDYPRGGGFTAPGDAGGFLHPRLLEQLGLTAEQRTQIETLQQSARTASEPFIAQLETIREQLKTALANGAFDEVAVREILAARARAAIDLEIVRIRTDAAIYNLLTTEQKARLDEIRSRRESHDGPGGSGARAPRN